MGTPKTSKAIASALLAFALSCLCFPVTAMDPTASRPQPIPVMILDGESNRWHDWRATTPMLRRMLEETGLFELRVVTAPGEGGDFSNFDPRFADHAAVVFNYDVPDGRWPRALQQQFEDYMRQGGGLVVVHAADNAFPGWRAFNEMIGVGGWRDRDERAGPAWYLDGDGRLQRDARPGPAGSHGLRRPFRITVRADHPITRGLPSEWMHGADELYAGLRGPGGMTVLASAFSDPANQGTGRHEPQLMASDWGRGRVFHTTLGHDPVAMASVAFVVTFQRGVEWAATGTVTQPLPADFPDATTPTVREELMAIGNVYQPHRQP
jgi:hypothetical protein